MNHTVPFLNVKNTYLSIKEEIDDCISRVLASGKYILGEEVEQFEESWATYCDAQYAIGVGNGLDALKIALLAIDIKPGDEVIVPSHTFIATWLAVSSVGGVPIAVDIDEKTYNINETKIESYICKKTKAIIPVHMYGHPCNLKVIQKIAKKYNLCVIEDAAQAHGTRLAKRRIGGISDITSWSFYPGKNLGAFGDGGAITTNNELLADKIRWLRNYGSNKKYAHIMKGCNSRLDPIQAAILNTKLKHLDEWNKRRNHIAEEYNKYFKIINHLQEPLMPKADSYSCWHLYVIQCNHRDELKKYLSKEGIQTLIHYPIPPFKQKAFKEHKDIQMPVASEICKKILSLPICPFMTEQQVKYVINSVNKFQA